jgi:hypothetical protein
MPIEKRMPRLFFFLALTTMLLASTHALGRGKVVFFEQARAKGRRFCQVLSLDKVKPGVHKGAGTGAGKLARCRVRLVNGARKIRRSSVGQFTAGLICDGPRDTWHGIKQNPKMFAAGMVITGAVGAVGSACGLPAHAILVCASAGTAGIDVVQTYRREYRHAASRAEKARLLGKMAWLPSLVAGTALVGGAVYNHSAGPTGHATSSVIAGLPSRFLGGIVTGGDAPVAAVTAVQHAKEP